MAAGGAHVIVVGNEKGGSGKSTTAFHLAIYLLHAGHSVATIDVDSRQQTFTHYVRNRRAWARQHDLSIPHATHFHLPLSRGDSLAENHRVEFDLFRHAVGEVEDSVDFLVIDTPGFDTNLTRLAHSLADTLITPVNDSLIDLSVMAQVDPVTGSICAITCRSIRLSLTGVTSVSASECASRVRLVSKPGVSMTRKSTLSSTSPTAWRNRSNSTL